MNFFSKIKQNIQIFFENVKQIKIDKDNRKKFLIEIQAEVANPASKFNTFKMSMDPSFKRMSCFISIPENYQIAGTEALILSKLREEARPINEYIGRDLAWGEYFISPEFYYVEDEEDKENVSCTYVASWQYVPVLDSVKGFWGKFTAFIIINLVLIGLLITGLIMIF